MYLKKLCHPRTTSFAQFKGTFQQALSQPLMTAMVNGPFQGESFKFTL
jgi:hypothetical protein